EVNGDGREVRVVRPPEDDAALRRALIRRNPMVHSTVTMRRLAVEGVGGYDARFAVAQDYDLWMRLAAVTRLANLPDALVVRRLLPGRVAVARDGALFDRFRESGIETVELATDRLRPRTLLALRRLVSERGVSLIHSHGKGAGLYGRLVARLLGVPAVHTLHGLHFEGYG